MLRSFQAIFCPVLFRLNVSLAGFAIVELDDECHQDECHQAAEAAVTPDSSTAAANAIDILVFIRSSPPEG